MKRGIILLVSFLLAACATSGNPNVVNQEITSQLKIGASSKEDVRRLLGEPTFISQSNNIEIWGYGYSNIETSPVTFIPVVGLFAGSSSVESGSVAVTFGQDGIVQNITRSQTKAVGGPGAR